MAIEQITKKKPKIMRETNYDKFDFDTINRPINEVHKQNLKESLGKRYALMYNPIQVYYDDDSEKYVIVDGQHRFVACRELGYPIFFVLVEGGAEEGRDLIKVQNTGGVQRNWNGYDYLESYVKQGKLPYQTFKTFMEFWGFTIDTALVLLRNAPHGGANYKDFIAGNFVPKDVRVAEEVANMAKDFKDFLGANWKRRAFISAMLSLYFNPQYNHDTMLSKANLQPRKFVRCSTKNQYLEMMEEIYNYRNRDKARFV